MIANSFPSEFAAAPEPLEASLVYIFCVSCADFLETRRGKPKGKTGLEYVCVPVYKLEITVNQQIRSLDTLISTA